MQKTRKMDVLVSMLAIQEGKQQEGQSSLIVFLLVMQMLYVVLVIFYSL